jgi:signal transduction histidine kinase
MLFAVVFACAAGWGIIALQARAAHAKQAQVTVSALAVDLQGPERLLLEPAGIPTHVPNFNAEQFQKENFANLLELRRSTGDHQQIDAVTRAMHAMTFAENATAARGPAAVDARSAAGIVHVVDSAVALLVRRETQRSHLSAKLAQDGTIAIALLGALLVIALLRNFDRLRRRDALVYNSELERQELARQTLERASAEKSEFLSRVSHELRTPLSAVLGFSQLLELDSLTETQRESVEQILLGGRHLVQMIDEILDISRIESGSVELSLECVDVAPLLTEAVALCEPLAAEHSLELRAAIEGEQLYARADAPRVKQVLLHLLSNAIKYNRPDGSIVVQASQQRSGEVTIEVIDSGLGMTNEQLARLFSPFERLESAARGIAGTGLGLTLSKTLIEAMGGEITVRSKPASGTTFTITLPPPSASEWASAPAGPAALVAA